MDQARQFPQDPIDMYNNCGFAIINVFNKNQMQTIEKFAIDWIYHLLAKWTQNKEDSLPLNKYHIWHKTMNIDHENIFCAKNRHIIPDNIVKKNIINYKVEDFIHQIGVNDFELWDEGLGWLGFRFIRPGFGDGYPFTKKEWGIAKNVISCWVPIIGHSPHETLTLVPRSHLRDYKKYLPKDNKFRGDEFRLSIITDDMEIYNPSLKCGDVIFYHPKTLHSEDVVASNTTRLSLEFRIDPKIF